MEIKKGDRFRCISDQLTFYSKGQIYKSEHDGCITNRKLSSGEEWGNDWPLFFARIESETINPTKQVSSDMFDGWRSNRPNKPLSDSPTSPSHYKAYDVESIEMAIRIWGKEEVAIFSKISAFCYRMRMGMKDDVSIELGKEKWFLNKWKELRDDVTG